VLDLMMPEVSGFDVIRELRSHQATADLPIIVLSAKVLDPSERLELETSVHSVLAKGEWDETKFLRVIRTAIQLGLRRKSGRAMHAGDPGQQASQHAVPNAPDQMHVLVIGDDAASRDLLRLYLEDAGYAVTSASGTDLALTKLHALRPDLVTLDLAMPSQEGRAFLASYCQIEHLRGIPILAISSAGERGQALASGVKGVLNKPIRRTEYLELVRQVLGVDETHDAFTDALPAVP
jgi:CheY-like chemotaxis protein